MVVAVSRMRWWAGKNKTVFPVLSASFWCAMSTESSTRQTGRIGPVRVLARRSRFRILFVGIAASRLGDTFFGVALAWLVLTIGSPRDLGLLILLGGIPRAITAPMAGHLIDRFGLRAVLGLDNSVRGLVLLIIPLLAASGACGSATCIRW